MAASSLGRYDSLSFTFMKAHKNQKQLCVVVPSFVSSRPCILMRPWWPTAFSPPSCHAFSHDTQAICCKYGIIRVSSWRGDGTLSIDTYIFQTTTTTCSPSAFYSPTRNRARRRPRNDRSDEKRWGIINGFYETELELIYSVSCIPLVASAPSSLVLSSISSPPSLGRSKHPTCS